MPPKISEPLDSVAEGDGFELSVPIVPGPRATALSRAIEQAILALHHGVVKAQKGGRLQYHSHLAQALHEKRTHSQHQPIPWGKLRSPALRTLHDEQLLFDRQ
jgi:hypothetical protein